jgi:SAM-dependent methyltransferase
MRWPLPALLSWIAAWLALAAGRAMGLAPWPALALAAVVGLGLAFVHAARWRRAIVALGFPVSVLALGLPQGLPGWLWLAPLALLLLLYPRRTWGDAPLFPTPPGALAPLAHHAALPPGARVLDAGCGVGDGLRELARVYPGAQIEGIEWSGPLRLLARWRAPRARVFGRDMWALDWGGYQLVYLFQRPESMPRAWAKAQAEMAPGAWLLSLDFGVHDLRPTAHWQAAGGQSVWLYRVEKSPAKPVY